MAAIGCSTKNTTSSFTKPIRLESVIFAAPYSNLMDSTAIPKLPVIHKGLSNDTANAASEYAAYLTQASSTDSNGHSVILGPLVNDSTKKDFYPPQSFFKGHALHKTDNWGYSLIERTPEWLPSILLFSIFILALIRFVYYKKLRIVLLAPFSSRHMSLLLREGESFSPPMRIYLTLNYLITFSLAIYLLIKELIPQGLFIEGFIQFLAIFILTLALFNTKLGVISFLGWLFKTPGLSFQYRLNIRLFTIIQGIILIPLAAGAALLPGSNNVYFLIVAGVLVLLLNVYKFIRGFVVGFQDLRFAGVYIFVYLCTLEILPILIVVKILKNHHFA
jgi:hypothetical protein